MAIYIVFGIIAGTLAAAIALYWGIYLPYVGIPLIGASGWLASILANRIGRGRGNPLPA